MSITRINTLGPSGTNCEKASFKWLMDKSFKGSCQVVTHETLEAAIDATLKNKESSLTLGCVVYPHLHEIVFQNIRDIVLLDVFMCDTFDMVLAGTPNNDNPKSIASHAAPRALVLDIGVDIIESSSNVQAAKMCHAGLADACLTTEVGAEQYGLNIIKRFGPVRMGFTIHGDISLLNQITSG